MHRRSVLKAAGSAVATALVAPGGVCAQAVAPATLVVFLIAPASAGTGSQVSAAAGAFTGRGLPVGLTRTAATTSGADRPPAPALWTETAISLPRYFQARALTDARAASPLASETNVLVAPDPGTDLALEGLSPAGFRCAFLRPTESQPAWVETHPARVVASRGGHVARIGHDGDPAQAADAAMAYLHEAADDPQQGHAALYLELDGPPPAVASLAATLAAEIAQMRDAGFLVPLAPAELGARHVRAFERLVALRLDPPPGTPADDAALLSLTQALADAGIAHSVSRDDPATLGVADCLRLTPGAAFGAGLPDAARGWHTAIVTPPDPRAAPVLAAAGIAAASGAGPDGLRGIDGNGLLHLGPVIPATRADDVDALPNRLGLCDDALLALDTGALTLPVQRNAMVAALRRLAGLPGTRIVDLAEFTRVVGASDPVQDTLRRVRTMAPEIAARAPEAPDTDPPMADARRAWSYFTTVTHAATGLPDATVAFDPDGTIAARHDMLTQWDVGSAIFGWIAALDLGLTDADAFAAWRGTLLATLTATTLPKPRLPRAMFSATAPWRGAADFNICDAARLLAALKALERRSPADDDAIADLVAGWDIADMVIDGVPHSLDRGTPHPGPDSHCTSYIKRALALWGIEATSTYDVYAQGRTEADAAMHLLNEVADIGTFGAEPLLQEALEFGFDAPGRVLRDVLMAEQIAFWTATGQLAAPSEGPMDRPPWFTYQGLRLDRAGPSRWDVISLTPGGETPTPAFRAAARMVTSKAPFLWAAAHPHSYCDRLVGYVRQLGQMQHGYVSGIYTATNTPTVGYGDINTNGVILEAVAALLGKPIRL